MYQTIIFSTADSIATIKLNRPEKLNAFGGPMREEILDALEKIARDDDIRAVIVTGEGRAFSAGGNIHHLKQLRDNKEEYGFRNIRSYGQKVRRARPSLGQSVRASDE